MIAWSRVCEKLDCRAERVISGLNAVRALQPPASAVTVRDGKASSTDGPYIEAKEFLGGFFLIDARDLDEAKKLAALSPMASMGSIEIRPVLDQTHSVTGEGGPLM